MPAGLASLTSVSCGSAGDCVATGVTLRGNAAIIRTPNGGVSWRAGRLPGDVTGLKTAGASAVSCASATYCMAVFSSRASRHGGVVLVTRDGGSGWTRAVSPGKFSALPAVACLRHCLVAGQTPAGAAVVAVNAGPRESWVTESLPADSLAARGLACASAVTCVAVGATRTGSAAIAVSRDGGLTWSARPAPAGITALSGVSCASATTCVAVGTVRTQRGAGAAVRTAAVIATADAGANWMTERVPAGVNRAVAVSATEATAQVVAATASGATIFSEPVPSRPVHPATPPSPVTSLKVTGTTATSVSLSWVDPPSATYAGVMIRRATGSTPPSSPTSGTLVAKVTKPGAKYVNTGLTAWTTYSYSVFAYNSTSQFSTGAHVTATTSGAPVTSLKVTAKTPSSLSLSWSNPSNSSFAGVMVRRAAGTVAPASPTSGTLVAKVAKPGAAFSDSGLTASTTYSYALFSYNATSRFSAGTHITATTASSAAGPVTALKVTTTTGTTISLSWTNPAPGASDFQGVIIRRTSGTSPPSSPSQGTLVATLGPTATSFTDTGLNLAATYSYAVFSFNAEHLYSSGTDVTGTTAATNPPGCTTTWTGASSSSWEDASNWTNRAVPGPGDWACIPVGSPNLPVQLSGTETAQGVTNSGGLAITGSLTLTNPTQPSTSAGPLSLSGSLAVGGSLSVSGALDAGGTLDGPGVLKITSAGSLTSDSLDVMSGSVVNDGTASIPPSDAIFVAAGASFTNASSLALGQDSQLYGGCAQSATATSPAIPGGTFVNTGTVTASATTQFPAGIGFPFNACLVTADSGTITITSGTLDLAGSNFVLKSGAVISGPAAAEIDIAGGEVDISSGASISGPSTIDVEGTLSTQPSLTIPTLLLNGTLQGSGNVSVTSALSGGGTYNGAATVTVQSGASLTSNSLNVQRGTLVNHGTASIPGDSELFVAAGATFTNTSALSLGQSSVMDGGCAIAASPGSPAVPAGTFVNTGTVTASATTQFPAGIGFPNNACLATNDTGTISIASGTLDLAGSAFELNSGAVISGNASSVLDISAGEVGLNAGASITGVPTIDVEGTLTTQPALTVPTLVLNGTLQGSGNVSVTSALSGGGTYNGAGTVTVQSGASLTSNSLNIQSGALVNHGTASIPANASLFVAAGATFTNTSALSLGQSSEIFGGCAIPASATSPAVPAGTFDNSGPMTASGSTQFPAGIGFPSNACLATNDTGTITIASGTLDLAGSTVELNSGAAISGTTSTVLDISAGEVDLSAGASITGVPTIDVQGTLTTQPALTIPALVLDGTLQGPGNITVTSALSGNGSYSGTGTVTVQSGATLTSGSLNVQSGALVNHGTAAIPANDQLFVAAGATFTSTSSLALGASSTLYGGCAIAATPTSPAVPAGTFVNSGTITASGTTQFPAGIGFPFDACMVMQDSGPIDITSGTLDLGGSGAELNSGAVLAGGPSSELDVVGGEVDVNAGASITGVPTIDVQGTLSTQPALTIPTLMLNGTLQGAGNISVTSSLTGGGSYSGTGTVTVQSGAALTSSSLSVESGALINHGTGSIPANDSLFVASGATFTNTASLALGEASTLYGGCAVGPTPSSPPIPAGSFTNSGTVTASGTAGFPAQIGTNNACMVTDDTGTINISGGTLDLTGSSAELNSGAVITGGSSSVLDLTGGETDLNPGASISGLALIDVTGTFKISEGISLPALSLSGTVELAQGIVAHTSSIAAGPSGTLQLDVSGPGEFGELVTGGAVDPSNLTLDINSGSYVPVCGTAVTALAAGSVANSFGSIFGPLPDGGSWQVTSTSTTAGGDIFCPPPAAPTAQTFGTGSSDDSVNPSGYFAEPVNTATGAYSTTATDASLAGIGVPFSFTRSYTSSDTYSGPLGPGWTDSMNVFLTGSTQGSVTLYSEDGQQATFAGAGNGTYNGPAGGRSVLTDVAGGGWLLVRKDQDHLTFNASGQLISETDRNGIGLTLAYNPAGQLASATEDGGRTVTFSYNATGLLSQLNFPPGRSVSYGYNPSGQLTSVTDAAGGVTSYTYNAAGLLATITDQNGHQVVGNTYDSSGRVISQVNALGKTATFSFDASTSTCTYTDPDGNKWQDVYAGDVLVERIDPLGDTTKYSYDAELDTTAITDPNGNTTTMSYDAVGNMLTKTDPSPISATQTWTYDALNDVTSYTDGDGNKTTYSYDATGNLASEQLPGGATVTWVRNAAGLPTSKTDENGNTISYSYTASGDLASVTSPRSEVTSYTYDAAGRKVTMTSPRGNVSGANPAQFTTSYAYDALDNLTSVTDPDGDITSTSYDAVGNKISVTDPNGNTTSNAYNAENELTAVTAPGGAVTAYTYDAVGNKTSMTDPNGNATSYGYDAAGRLTSVTNPLGQSTTYTYDAAGNTTSTTDATGTVTTKAYDALNRVTSVSYTDGTPTVSFGYDANGNRTSMSDGIGTTTYGYNARGELTSVTGPGGAYSYSYDGTGDVTSRIYPDGRTVSYAFDSDNRLHSVTADGSVTTLGYDADSNLTTVTYPNGNVEASAFDPAERLSSVEDQNGSSVLTSFSYTYDAAGNPTKIVTPSQTDTYGYDSRERLTTVCYGTSCANGSVSYAYDNDGNRTSETTSSGVTTYSYNAASQLTSVTDSSGTTTDTYDAAGRLISSGPVTYTWNGAGELASVSSGGAATSYQYDGNGDRVFVTSGGTTTSESYDVNNPLPLLAAESSGGSELRGYVWGAGMLLSMRAGGADYYIGHDAQDSVVALTSASGTTEWQFSYDPFGVPRTTSKVDQNAPSIPLRFESQYLDPTGLYQLRARSMNPAIGGFVSPDPVTPPITSAAISPYLYAADQPTVLEDLSGQSWRSIFDVGFKAVKDTAKSMAEDKVIGVVAGDTIKDAAGYARDVLSFGPDAISIATCGAWYSYACEHAYQQTGVDVAVFAVSLLCPETLVLALACAGAVAAAGEWALETWGIKPPSTPATEPAQRTPGYVSLK